MNALPASRLLGTLRALIGEHEGSALHRVLRELVAHPLHARAIGIAIAEAENVRVAGVYLEPLTNQARGLGARLGRARTGSLVRQLFQHATIEDRFAQTTSRFQRFGQGGFGLWTRYVHHQHRIRSVSRGRQEGVDRKHREDDGRDQDTRAYLRHHSERVGRR